MSSLPHNQILDTLKAAADISDWGYGRWAYEKWEVFNTRYFEGTLTPGGIFWGLTPHGRSLGFYEPWRNSITLHTSLVAPTGENPWRIGKLLGERLAEDVLLHEMMHLAITQCGGDPSPFTHNSEIWCAEINRLIPLLEVTTDLVAKPVRQKRIREPGQVTGKGRVQWVTEEGAMTRRQLASFPHCLRSLTYYQSAAERLLRANLVSE